MERLFRMFATATFSSFRLLRGLVQSPNPVIANRLSQHHGDAMFESGYSTDYRGLQQISRAYRKEVDRPDSSNEENNASKEIPKPLPDPPNPSRVRWVVGSILSLLIPFWKLKWDQLQQIEGKAEEVIEDAEIVAEVVEKVATAAEKVSAQVADELPDDSKLKEAALFVEHVSEVTAQDAHLTENFIHKFDEVKQEVETAVETGIRKMMEQPSEELIQKPSEEK
ncbi:uncharacterized protein LOC115679767 isoform X2 [Syzygium oleosum]|uniref:uncharacterized protein LOC115679767 isoform X2 n=1 Tax=Syzygium oleosum TaxID=219896 RepID=UPI0011D2645A|nr:uncharacterized protein LOC115679767 isoform X2 [Syzygium oleosum]